MLSLQDNNNKFQTWAERFMYLKREEGLSKSRVRGIQNNISHLVPLFDCEISEIIPWQIQGIINCTKLSKKTLCGIKWTAKSIFDLAINNRVITFNPVMSIKIPKNAYENQRGSITDEQQQWIFQTEHRAKRLAMIMLFAGLRRGECVALTWDDIDFNNKTISITKSVEFVKNQPVIKSPKTKAGIRVIDMPDILASYLKQERAADPFKFVVHKADEDEMLSECNCRNLWKSYMNDLNLIYGCRGKEKKYAPHKKPLLIEKFTMHQLRHTYATLLYFAEIDVMTARDYLGHADIKTTLNIYTHLDQKFKKRNVDKLNIYFENVFSFPC